jgi:hypothetical protein
MTENKKVKVVTLKVKNNTLEKLSDIKKMYNLSSLNDTILFLIMKLELCESQRVIENENSVY